MYSPALVRLFAEVCKNYWTDFHEIWWKGDTCTTEETLDFGGNPDHVTLGLGRVRMGVELRFCGGANGTLYGRILCLFNSNNFATSAALAEVCALLSAVLVCISFSPIFCAILRELNCRPS